MDERTLKKYRYAGKILRGREWVARPYEIGDCLKNVECLCFPETGTVLVYCDKGFLDTYLIPGDMFARDFGLVT